MIFSPHTKPAFIPIIGLVPPPYTVSIPGHTRNIMRTPSSVINSVVYVITIFSDSSTFSLLWCLDHYSSFQCRRIL